MKIIQTDSNGNDIDLNGHIIHQNEASGSNDHKFPENQRFKPL